MYLSSSPFFSLFVCPYLYWWNPKRSSFGINMTRISPHPPFFHVLSSFVPSSSALQQLVFWPLHVFLWDKRMIYIVTWFLLFLLEMQRWAWFVTFFLWLFFWLFLGPHVEESLVIGFADGVNWMWVGLPIIGWWWGWRISFLSYYVCISNCVFCNYSCIIIANFVPALSQGEKETKKETGAGVCFRSFNRWAKPWPEKSRDQRVKNQSVKALNECQSHQAFYYSVFTLHFTYWIPAYRCVLNAFFPGLVLGGQRYELR